MALSRTGRYLRHLLVALLSLSGAPALGAQQANPLVTPADVEQHHGRWVVLDCRDVQSSKDGRTGEALEGYADGHIPGAVTLGGDCSRVLREKDVLTVFKDTSRYEEILGAAGIGDGETVVVYGDTPRIANAAVAYWILEYLGQRDVRFLDGGIGGWVGAGKKVEVQASRLRPRKYAVHLAKDRIATTEEVLKVARGEDGETQLVDVRTAAEYAGSDVRAKRGGHVPHARLNVSHVEDFDKATGKLKPRDALNALYGTLDKKRRTVVYCQTGTRSALAYLALRLAGFEKPANYDDSWIIWGNRDDLPVER